MAENLTKKSSNCYTLQTTLTDMRCLRMQLSHCATIQLGMFSPDSATP